jgi:hypothetical protein
MFIHCVPTLGNTSARLVSALPAFMTAGELAITVAKANTAQTQREHLEHTRFAAALEPDCFFYLSFPFYIFSKYKNYKEQKRSRVDSRAQRVHPHIHDAASTADHSMFMRELFSPCFPPTRTATASTVLVRAHANWKGNHATN